MSLDKKNLRLLFFTCLLLTLVGPFYSSGLHLLYLTPFIVVAIYQKSLIQSCWIALGCGLFLDLLYGQTRLGPFALSFVAATACLYSQKKHFFADNLTTLPIVTFLFSSIVGVVQIVAALTFAKSIHLSMGWMATDLLVLPAIDGLSAFILYIVPSFLFGKRRRSGSEYFTE